MTVPHGTVNVVSSIVIKINTEKLSLGPVRSATDLNV